MQILPSELQIGAAQEQGKRKEQQDYFAVIDLANQGMSPHEQGLLAVLADGMGGHAKSGNASVIAVNTFVKSYQEEIAKPVSIPKAIGQALIAANQAVFEANQKMKADMGTTLVACVIQGKKLHWVSVGDSSLYLYTKGKLSKINQSHSYGAEIQEKLNAGMLTPEEAQLEPKKRNMLTSYLGLEKIPKIDFSETHYQLELGHKILLCSDGLDNALNQEEIEECLRREMIAQEKCDRLMTTALEKQRPNQDNITIILSELEPKTETTKTNLGITQPENDSITKTDNISSIAENKWFIPILLVLLLMVLLSVIGFFVYPKFSHWWNNKPVYEETRSNDTIATEKHENQNSDKKPTAQPRVTIDEEKVAEPSQQTQQKKCENSLTLSQVQEVLKEHGYYTINIDGKWGEKTQQAIKQYQQENSLTLQTGYLNPETCESLLEDFNRLEQPLRGLPHRPGEP